nr:MAG TPA: hypothetical protein [Caudoviricetes sp.]
MSSHDVGNQAMNSATVTTIDDHIVLVMLKGNNFLGRGDNNEHDAILRLQVVRSDDMNAILSRGQNAEVVGNLHTRDLSLISEDPVNAILQETDQRRMSNSNDDFLGSLQLLLQLVDNALEVLTRIGHPVADVTRILLIRHHVEGTLNNRGHLIIQSLGSRLLTVIAILQEATDLQILELSQATTHNINVISNHIDLLQSQSISSFLDSDRSVETGARLRHDVLDLLNAALNIQRTLVETVSQTTRDLNLGNLIGSSDNGNSASHEIDSTNQSIINGSLSSTNVGLVGQPVMSSDISTDVNGNPLSAIGRDSRDIDLLSQHLALVLSNNDTGNILLNQNILILQRQIMSSIGIEGQTHGLVNQRLHFGRVIEDLRDLITIASSSLDVTLLVSQIDNRRGGNLSHQDILEDAANPLLLQEEGVVSNDRSVALHDSLTSNSVHAVLNQLANAVSEVVVERSILQLGRSKHRITLKALQQLRSELLALRGASDDAVKAVSQVDALRHIRLKDTLNFTLETLIRIRHVVITNHVGLDQVIQNIFHV